MNFNNKLLNYFPMQPGFFSETDNYIERQAPWSYHNRQNVIFFQFAIRANPPIVMQVVPDGCFDIIFNCSPDQPCVHIYGKIIRGKQFIFQPGCTYFGVRLFPKQTLQKLNYSMKELIDEVAPLEECLKINCDFYENMAMKGSFAERIRYFQQYVDRIGAEMVNGTDAVMMYCIDKICTWNGNMSMTALCNETGYSDRYLRMKFEESIGISPKRFSQIIRFQNCLKMILHARKTTLEDIMFDNGYYDQAHFFKDFKNFSILTPCQIRGDCRPAWRRDSLAF